MLAAQQMAISWLQTLLHCEREQDPFPAQADLDPNNPINVFSPWPQTSLFCGAVAKAETLSRVTPQPPPREMLRGSQCS